MKKMKKIFALLIAMVMVLGMSTSVFAASIYSGDVDPSADDFSGTAVTTLGNEDNASITVTLPTIPEGYTGTNTYKIYKVFDATNDGSSSSISYSVMSSKNGVPSGFILDDAGNVYLGTTSTTKTGAEGEVLAKVNGVDTYITPQKTELTTTQIAAIKSYINGDSAVATVTTTESDKSFTVAGLEYGYYYITTTTGTVVTVDSTNPNASVKDKNTVTTEEKTVFGVDQGSFDADGKNAIAQVGTDVDFEVEITLGDGATNLALHDAMTNLSYNKDAKAYIRTTTGEGDDATVTDTEIASTNYTDKATPDTGDTLTITFNDTYIESLASGTVIVVKYSGKVTSDALSTTPGKNSATVTYGDNNKTTVSEVKVYNAKITVTKTDGDGAALAGAGFVVKNASNQYYKLTPAAAAQDATVTWYTLANGETLEQAIAAGKVTELTTTETSNVVAFTGLANGTYTLIESTVPEGYNPAADSTFTINAATADGALTTANLEQTSTVVNNEGSELPSTGGIGTTIFYIIGAILVIGAGVVLVTRRRMNAN